MIDSWWEIPLGILGLSAFIVAFVVLSLLVTAIVLGPLWLLFYLLL